MSLPRFINSLVASLVTLLALASACRGPARSDSRSPAEQSSALALTGPKALAARRCNDAREKARAAVGTGVACGQAFAGIGTACTDLYTEPGCANAFRASATLPLEKQAASIALACRDAYCPKLEPPKPILCALAETRSQSQMLAMWPELDTRILAFELNVSVEEAEQLVLRCALPVVDAQQTNMAIPTSSTESGSAASVLTVSIGVDANGRPCTWVDGEPPELLPVQIDVGAFASVAAKAKKRTAAQVVIAVDKRATYSQVVALIDALNKEGISTVAMQLVPSSEP